jgi:hypothetical protein
MGPGAFLARQSKHGTRFNAYIADLGRTATAISQN